MAAADIPDLFNFYNSLSKAMGDLDAIISDVDGKYNLAKDNWTSKGSGEFETQWGTFLPQLNSIVQAFAHAGTSVGTQHNQFAVAAQEADQHPVLPALVSPR